MRFALKNPQVVKELRPLVLPWIGAVAAGSMLAVRPLVEGEGFEGLFLGIAVYGFFGGLAFLTALSFGSEFHERTLPLLLSQPQTRFHLWNQKMLIAAVAVTAGVMAEIVLLTGISSYYSGNEVGNAIKAALPSEDMLLAGFFLLVTVCSCSYWTLVAGSILGGLVFTVVAEMTLGTGVTLTWTKLRGYERPFQDLGGFVVLISSGIIYSTILLWLGRRKFARLEVRNTGPWRGMSAPGAENRTFLWSSFLISRPTTGALNLVRKEIRLQKPVAQMAVAFSVCWAGIVLLQGLWPRQKVVYLFDILTCLYAPITSLLAGCVPLGEEKLLGVTASQLTLPFPAMRQWLLKLVIGTAAAALLSLGLPLLLFGITSVVCDLSSSDLMNLEGKGLMVLSCISGISFLLGYWAISLTPSTVQAALAAVVGVIVLGICIFLGTWYGSHAAQLGHGFWTGVMCHFQLPPGFLWSRVENVKTLIFWSIPVPIIFVLLGQSFAQFRRAQAPARKLMQYSVTLAAIISLVTYWVVQSMSSIQLLPRSEPVAEVQRAIRSIAQAKVELNSKEFHRVSAQDLEGRVSQQTKTWLRNAAISYSAQQVVVRGFAGVQSRIIYQTVIAFPNGLECDFASDLYSK